MKTENHWRILFCLFVCFCLLLIHFGVRELKSNTAEYFENQKQEVETMIGEN